ncbi:TetR/AcrR family transcriptional regulator [Streptomyces sp. NPDC060194]|uniref:TetR/AcrR family transcriptional regulator n=1 Tax=Streptomyces sp. NPDC060194 TaxID=3347069 RepID=UPI0036576FD6
MRPRTDPRLERTRSKVLAAANDLLLELGFGEVTIDDISARSGVARSTLYRHWDTKDEILRDAFSFIALPEAGRPEGAGAGLCDELRHYTRVFARGLTDVWGRAAATLAASAVDDPDRRAVIATFRTGYVRDVGTLLERAAARGETVRGGPEEVADRLLGPLFYRYLISHQPLDEAFLAPHVDEVCARVLGT